MPNVPLTLSQPRLSVAHWYRRAWQLCNLTLLALQVRNERRTLRGLDDRALKDLGFSRSAADCESSRAFWDLPTDRTWT